MILQKVFAQQRFPLLVDVEFVKLYYILFLESQQFLKIVVWKYLMVLLMLLAMTWLLGVMKYCLEAVPLLVQRFVPLLIVGVVHAPNQLAAGIILAHPISFSYQTQHHFQEYLWLLLHLLNVVLF